MDEAQNASGVKDEPQSGGADGERAAELSREAAAYRTQRNTALREAHAYRTMLEAHGIDLAPASADALAKLPIASGKVDGVFVYAPPKIQAPVKPDPPEAAGSKSAALSRDDLERMPPEEINKRWDEVRAVLEAR